MKTRRNLAVLATLTLTGFVGGASSASAASKPAYCKKATGIMDTMNIADIGSPAAAAKAIKAGAAAFRASNPPAQYKTMVSDYAKVLDLEADAIKSATSADVEAKMAKVVRDPKNVAAISKMVLFVAKTCV